jgi:hypothetical protein
VAIVSPFSRARTIGFRRSRADGAVGLTRGGASELAANAALHSNSRLPGGTFTVRVAISPCDQVRIEVEDNGGPWTPAAGDTERHHGLDIIRILATDSGIDGDHASRTAWARFDWPVGS